MLLTAALRSGYWTKTDGRYRNTPLSEAYLVRGKPYYFGGFVQMADKRLYAGWGRLAEALRANRPTTWDPAMQSSMFDSEDPTVLALFWEAMHSLSTMTARELGEAVDLGLFPPASGHRRRIGRVRHRALQAVRGAARDRVRSAACGRDRRGKNRRGRLTGRIDTVGGNFFDSFRGSRRTSPVDDHARLGRGEEPLLRRSFQALPSGGAVVISELLVNDEKTGPAPAALMSLNMLIETEGRNYTPPEYSEWLDEAGFRQVETIWFDAPAANGAVIGRKP